MVAIFPQFYDHYCAFFQTFRMSLRLGIIEPHPGAGGPSLSNSKSIPCGGDGTQFLLAGASFDAYHPAAETIGIREPRGLSLGFPSMPLRRGERESAGRPSVGLARPPLIRECGSPP